MKETPEHNERIAKLIFASVYPLYIAKLERKGRTKKELHQVIEWLTGFDEKKLQEFIEEKATFKSFFANAKLNPKAQLISAFHVWKSKTGTKPRLSPKQTSNFLNAGGAHSFKSNLLTPNEVIPNQNVSKPKTL